MIFQDDFFLNEIRNDFEVPALMKRAWAAQLEVLEVVRTICQKNKLTYFASDGTLLGAIRHNGFIPWDDDIDICMLRPDYNKLRKILPDQLPPGFIIDGTFSSEKKYQVLNSNPQLRVVALRELWDFDQYIQRFHGYPFPVVGIDIFPLDYIPDDSEEAKIQQELVNLGTDIASNWYILDEKIRNDRIKIFEEYTGAQLDHDNLLVSLWRLVDSLASLYTQKDGSKLMNMAYKIGPFSADWFQSSMTHNFENTEINVPKNYKEILTTFYGDYQKLVRNTALHHYPYYEEMEKNFLAPLRDAGIQDDTETIIQKLLNKEFSITFN
ncbi:MAG: LicD family protein [Eubacterium sp.]|nr:LicD family protein [Eubacterium sp.]